jgi:hypothetical protein
MKLSFRSFLWSTFFAAVARAQEEDPAPMQAFPAPCVTVDPTWTRVFDPSSPIPNEGGFAERCDDCSLSEISLPFTFNFYGLTYDKVYVNMNGNLSFESSFDAYSAEGFPSDQFIMVAPFWADVDNRGTGEVYVKQIGTTAFAVAWVNVGYFASRTDKLNTFQVIITDGTGSLTGTELSNVCYCYGDMQWTTGDADSGVGGFGGNPATVGANRGVSSMDLIVLALHFVNILTPTLCLFSH